MTNSKTTKRALLASIVSLVLCFSMLLGTTYAWFTDSAATAVNTIQAGNLDIEVLYATPADVVNGAIPEDSWKVVDEQTPVFNPKALWEPGYTEVVYFKYVNKGSLSLQFQMHVDILNETKGINVYNETFALSDYIEAYVCGATDYQFQLYETRDEALNPPYAPDVWHGPLKEVAGMEAVATPNDPSTELSLDTWNWLEPAEEYYTTLVLFMPTTIDNVANHKTGTPAPTIDLGINFIATQYNWENEKDSYDHNYDEKAEYPILTADDLNNALKNAKPGDVIGLSSGVDYGTITLGTLNNVTIKGAKDADIIVKLDANTEINNVTLTDTDFVYTGGNADFAIVLDSNAKVNNFTVSNCTFTGNGSKAGRGLAGKNTSATIKFENCTFKDLGYPIYAWGGYKTLEIDTCTFDNIKSWAIMPQSGFDGDLTVNKCTFTNCLGGGLIKAGTLTAGHTFTFTNNTITGCTIAGDHNWFQFNVSAGTAVISGNIKEGAAWTPSASDGLK